MEPGQVIDEQYRLIRPIGEGGFGAVWLAEETALGRRVALKFLKRELDREELVRFKREVQALGRLAHDHILTLYSVGEHRGSRYIVTEFVSGQTLDDWKPRSMDDIVAVGTQIAAALVAAHREGVVHRDLKPPNVMVLPAANGAPLVKVLDFGIAKLAGPKQLDITATGDIVGTPGFMSPEQLRGVSDIGPASDLYNLGVILWELIEGRPIFAGESALEISMQHLVERPPRLTRPVPDFLGHVTFRLLEKEPQRRGTAKSALRSLREKDAGPSQAASTSPVEPAPLGNDQGLLAAAGVLIAVVVALATIAALVLFEPDSDSTRSTVSDDRLQRLNTPAREPIVVDVGPSTDDLQDIDGGTTATKIPDGCGNGWTPGSFVVSDQAVRERTVIELHRDDDQSIIYIPRSYEPSRRAPLVTVLHSGGETPELMFAQAKRLIELADARGVLVVFPEGARRDKFLEDRPKPRRSRPISDYPWDGNTLRNTIRLVALAQDILCVDPQRMFLVGHGRGARAAELLLAQTSDVFAAVAMSDYRRKAEDAFKLGRGEPIPYLWLTVTDSDRRPDNGKQNDCLTHDLTTREQQERDMLEHNRCSGPEMEIETSPGATCRTWSCEAKFVSCRVSGGRYWPDYPDNPQPCEGRLSSYDYGGEIWKFFEVVSRDP